MTKQVLQQALEALEGFKSDTVGAVESFEQCEAAIEALREALEQQEPVAGEIEERNQAVADKAGVELLSLAQQWADNKVHVYQFQQLAAQIVGEAMLAAAPAAQPERQTLTDKAIENACLSYRHDFGLMEKDERIKLRRQAREWAHAFGLDEAAPAAQPDARKVIEQMVGALKGCYGHTTSDGVNRARAIQAGQKWLEENK